MGTDADPRPTVSLIVAMRNEEKRIGGCVRSLLAQDYHDLEVIVVDGESTDRSIEIVEDLIRARPSFVLVRNPKRIQAAGWNQGIRMARGEIVGIVGGHSELAPDYVSAAVETLARTGAAMVGGPVHADASGAEAEAIALAIGSRFGVGNARFRYLRAEAEVDTVYMGVCRRETYLQYPFDEEMVRNQDDELSYRLLDAGLRIVCNPAIRSSYTSRANLPALARQYADYGYWKVRVIEKHPRQTRVRHLVPALLVAAVATSGVASLIWPRSRLAFAAVIAGYGMTNLGVSMYVGRTRGWRFRTLLAAGYATLHFSYGSGFIVGTVNLARSIIQRRLHRSASRSEAARDPQ